MADWIAAIDQGTTSTRCALFDRCGTPVMAQREHRQIYPRPGWVEHDPLEILERTAQVVAEAMELACIDAGDVAVLGITNQRETTVVWDRRTGRPLYNAIVWLDTRTQSDIENLASTGGADRFRARTGLPLATYFSSSKIRWILDRVPGARKMASEGSAVFGTIDSWLIWNLTGGTHGGLHVTDVTNASRTLLMDLRTLAWDQELLDAFDIPRQMLPKILPSSDPNGLGVIRALAPRLAGARITGVLGDQQAAMAGQGCASPGLCKNTYGTGCFVLLHTGQAPVESKRGLITTVAYQQAGEAPRYAIEGSIAVTGALVQWLRDNLKIISASSEIEALAASVPDNGGVYFVPAFSGLFAPRWRPDARGTIVGMTAHTTKAHIARAALEATAYQTRDVLQAMRADAGIELSQLRVDGGMAANDWLMQFQADILGSCVVRPRILETTALGAARAAGMAVGFFNDNQQFNAAAVDRIWEPRMGQNGRDALYQKWLAAVERSLGWV